mmetsp:Transcript_29166/g.67632  ORF Transcript_29166/g.67632 Transcript_29166/m.67632 type:complete len:204 (-) Transcript_29166:315-926(-)
MFSFLDESTASRDGSLTRVLVSIIRCKLHGWNDAQNLVTRTHGFRQDQRQRKSYILTVSFVFEFSTPPSQQQKVIRFLSDGFCLVFVVAVMTTPTETTFALHHLLIFLGSFIHHLAMTKTGHAIFQQTSLGFHFPERRGIGCRQGHGQRGSIQWGLLTPRIFAQYFLVLLLLEFGQPFPTQMLYFFFLFQLSLHLLDIIHGLQ